MDTPESVTTKAEPFFLGFFQNLSKELSDLTTTSVLCTLGGITLLRGADTLKPLFAKDQSVARVEEDANNLGAMHLVLDIGTSIAMAGMMMMTNEEIIRSKIENRDYDEETHEGFREVATQVIGFTNRQLEGTTRSGIHFFLDSAKHTDAGTIPSGLSPETTYLCVTAGIKVAEFDEAAACWLIARHLAEAILHTPIPGSEKEMAEANAGKTDTGFPDAGEIGEEEEEEEEEEDLPHTEPGQLLAPQVAGSVRLLMTETPFTLKEEEKVMRGITAITQDGYRYIGIERKGVLIRVLSQSDINQVMGTFYNASNPSPRDKALYALPIGKLHAQQQLVKISSDGSINQAIDLMREHSLHALPVVSNRGTLRGFVPIHAVLDYVRKLQEKKS